MISGVAPQDPIATGPVLGIVARSAVGPGTTVEVSGMGSGEGMAGSEPDPGGPGGRRPGTSLAELAPGARARVLGVAAPHGHAVGRRLAALGFTVGTVVEVVRRAPLGDPVIYRLKDYEVCLRRTEAALVRAEGGAA